MAGDAAPAQYDGVRRRHSGQSDNQDGSPSGPDDGVRIGVHTVDEHEQPHRVRFSTETDRRSMLARTKKRKSDEMIRDTDESSAQSRAQKLTLDTRATAIMSGGSVSGGPIVGSPTSMRSPPSSGSGSRRTPVSPYQPKSRNRGLSLRSSLFARNFDQRAMSGDSIIEMQAVGRTGPNSERPQTPKKGMQPSVTVSPVFDAAPLPPRRSPPQKGQQGASALPNYRQWVEKQAHHHLPIKRIQELYDTTRAFVLRIQEVPPSKEGRQIDLDPSRKDVLIDERTGYPFISNIIRSSKYTPLNFVPRQLFAQFSKLANFYFLIVATLQMIPGLSTTGTYTTIVPLLFFVAVSMGKEGYEDLRRHRLDKVENNREAKVLHAYGPTPEPAKSEQAENFVHWASVKWQSLKVGDVVKLERNDAAPADIVLLRSTGPNNIAYIETMALDGETNLKSKQPAPALISAFGSAESIAAGGAHFTVEDPNLDLYNFEGKVALHDKVAPLTNNEIIYRGSVLRNTPEAIGMVIYSGEECKIRMNANKNPRIKAPSLQAIVNKIVVLIVFLVLFIALFNTFAYKFWQHSTESKAFYLRRAKVPFGHILVSFIIMMNTMIPLSLYVSMEIIKVAQMLLLNDIDMYDEESNTPFEAHTTTINEELGQVGYIFSDKTGTLTENVMRFRKLSVAGTAWLHDADLKDLPEGEEMLMHKKRRPDKGKGKKPFSRPSRQSSAGDGGATVELGLPRRSISQWTSPATPAMPSPELSTVEMIRYIQRRPYTAFADRARMMILSMALCHTCLPERNPENDEDVTFQASSPDELALVQAAHDLGYLAYDREVSTLTLKTYPHGSEAQAVYESYQILDVIEFSSKRKRMSIVMRFPDGRICLMCKGADSTVMQRLRLAALANEKLNEVEDRVLKRRSMEAEQALRRKSSHIERKGSLGTLRTSTSLASPAMSRPSIGRLGPIRDEVDGWLRDREQDIQSPIDMSHYSPRPSAQFGRPSVAHSERQASLHSEVDDELVEEALVMDDAAVMERTFQHINDFATEGLRTLLYGYRFLDDEAYRSWKKIYHDATTSLVNRSDMVEKAGELIEQELELGGATAIEDKLQKGVPETIDRLRRATIKLWMLTGDKRETAINIGTSCRLIKDYSAVVVLDHEAGEVEQNIAAAIIDINRGDVAHSVVVVDGQTLAMINEDESLQALAFDLFILADTVICCRASPSQKASLVSAVRRRVNRSVTLAIGDGANDIAMIQEAHVGIGITGKEGLQAARTSDYAIAQFRFLTKLLLVHGRWNYIRTCKYIVGTFWKEMLFYLTQAIYQRYNGYTGTSLYESWSLSMFNTLFTSLVVIFLGIFEKDLHESTLIAVPELYTKGQRSAGFNFKVYFGWMFMAASEAMIVFFTMWSLFGNVIFTSDNSLYAMGDLTFTACVIIIATKLQVLEQRNKSIMALIAWVLAVGGWFLWNIILSAIYGSKTNPEYFVKGAFFHQFGRNVLWWLTLLLTVAACLLYEMAVRALKCAFFPTDVETFQTLEQDLSVRKRFEEASAPWLQAGWQRGTKKSSLELAREAEEQKRREGEVQELLDRPRVMEEGRNVRLGDGEVHRDK